MYGTRLLRAIGRVACALAFGALAAHAGAQTNTPIRIGFSIAQTGPLSAAGKSGLLALQIWRDDVNARGGLLGRQVELVVYDYQGSASITPGIYTKLIDVDKVDLLIAPYGTNPTASVMPLVKQRDLLLMGNFALDANAPRALRPRTSGCGDQFFVLSTPQTGHLPAVGGISSRAIPIRRQSSERADAFAPAGRGRKRARPVPFGRVSSNRFSI